MIPNREGREAKLEGRETQWHYLAVKKSSPLLIIPFEDTKILEFNQC